ncbi:MAG: hypothetical protein WD448_03085 [Woeseia sp.]
MSQSDRWLSLYEDSHRDMSQQPFYWLAVAALLPATAGMLWSLPVPAGFVEISPVLNWGTAFLMATLVYYFIISVPLAIGMLPPVFFLTALGLWLSRTGLSVAGASLGLMIAALGGLYTGHRGRGGTGAILRDIQLMPIGPIWLLSRLYRRLGIPF